MKRRLHFVGIGGVGMAGLAFLLKEKGFDVSGCDLHESARTRWLESQGIRVAFGHDPSHVDTADELIITPAVASENPELVRARETPDFPVRLRGEVLASCVNEADAIAVCGSHGKTTTATWTAQLLLALGESVRWCIGGETGNFPVGGTHLVGARAPVLVVEADESDGTLALYRAKTLVVNKCEYDHPDHFPTEADYFACYETARRQAGCVIESEELPPIPALGEILADLPEHNRKNARAAVEVALCRGHALGDIARCLPEIVAHLPDRRFQTIWPRAGEADARRVITDYAHHPGEMRCAIEMARRSCRGRLIVLFQPHRYSRTRALLNEFPSSLRGADEVVLLPTYAAFERPIEGGDVADLYAACRQAFGADEPIVRLARTCEEAWEHAARTMKAGDATLLLGAGDIINLLPRVCETLALSEEEAFPARTILIGQGTNTWKSDLRLNVRYARTASRAGESGARLLEDPTLARLMPWMAGIPGTLGGWIKMNAGAFGHSISEVLEAVQVDGRWIDAKACGFGYRTSAIQGEIQDARFRAAPCVDAPARTPAEYRAARRKFPAGTWGSFFKNPPGDFAGRLLESVGAKGMRVGGAFVWSEHANVLVAGEGSTSSDVLALARILSLRVFLRLGVRLEPEVRGILI